MPKNIQTTAQLHSSHMLVKVMLKILKATLQQYSNLELSDVHAGFRKGRGMRDQIANICWIMEKAREFQKKKKKKHTHFDTTQLTMAFQVKPMNNNDNYYSN